MNNKILGILGGVAAGTAINYVLDEKGVELPMGDLGKGAAISAAASVVAVGICAFMAAETSGEKPAMEESKPEAKAMSGLGNMRNMPGKEVQRSLVDEKLAEIMAAKKKNATPLTEGQKRARLNNMLVKRIKPE